MNHQAQMREIDPIVFYPAVGPLPMKAASKLSRIFDLNLAPPHALIEGDSSYSIVFNMLGIEQKGIGIDLDLDKREVTVLARRDRENFRNGFFWTFGVPQDALLSEMTTRFKAGVLEIVIPKTAQLIVA